MKIKVFQKGFNYSQDGDGNRLVFHLQGCNMRCPWCANPEGMAVDGSLMVDDNLLVQSVCPHNAIHEKNIDRSICEKCTTRECISLRKNMGIRLSYDEYDVERVVEEAKRCSPLFYDGGGVTLSGGEPTLQFDAVNMLLKVLKEAGINTAIETNATHPNLDKLFPLIDVLIMDFKHYGSDKCSEVTGIGNSIIKDNISKALTYHKRVHIRTPIIKGFNSSENDARNFARFYKQFPTANASFEFLPYHEYGKAKWIQCGMPYMMKDAFVNPETITMYEKIFNENNLLVVRT